MSSSNPSTGDELVLIEGLFFSASNCQSYGAPAKIHLIPLRVWLACTGRLYAAANSVVRPAPPLQCRERGSLHCSHRPTQRLKMKSMIWSSDDHRDPHPDLRAECSQTNSGWILFWQVLKSPSLSSNLSLI